MDSITHGETSVAQAFVDVANIYKGKVDDIHAIFAEKRKEQPIMKGDILDVIGIPSRAQSPNRVRPVYSLFGFSDIQAVLKDAQTFSSALHLEHLGAFTGRLITGLDGDEHKEVRQLLQPAFSPTAMQSWRADIIQPCADALLDDIVPRGRGDLFEDICIPFPMHAIYGIIGFPLDDRAQIDRFGALAVTILCGLQIDESKKASAQKAAMDAAAEVLGKARIMIEKQRATNKPGFDLIRSLMRSTYEGKMMDDDEIAGFVLMLLPAAAETTTRTLANLFSLLLRNPDQLEKLRNDRSLVARAISEAVRYEPVAMYLARETTRDTEIGGVHIPKGSGLQLVAGSGNRDDQVWENGDAFAITRKMKPSLGFGYGAHMCMGAVVARAEMEVIINAILDRMPNLRLDPDGPSPTIQGAHFRCPSALPVLWDA